MREWIIEFGKKFILGPASVTITNIVVRQMQEVPEYWGFVHTCCLSDVTMSNYASNDLF